MKLVPISYLTETGKRIHAFLLCGDNEDFANIDNMNNLHIIPQWFLKSFLEQKGYDLPSIAAKGLAEIGEKHIFESGADLFVTPQLTRAILKSARLSYEEFIDKYAEYLKAL